MFSFLKKKKAKPAFVIDFPQISITPDTQTSLNSLKESGVAYTVVTDGYITFAGKGFGCDIPLMFGIHFNASKVEHIEVFRPIEYYQSEHYDINESFSQLSDALRKRYGQPFVNVAALIDGQPRERWHTPNYIINHYIMERFGLEEHLHISFHEK